MVRIKYRYLLVNILYPEQESRKTKPTGSGAKDDLPYTVQFRRPGPEQLNGKLLTRLIREGVSDLFGDYGSGMVTGSLVGKSIPPIVFQSKNLTHAPYSKILLPSNKHSHHPRRPRALPHSLGSTVIHDQSTSQINRSALCDASGACLWDDPQS